MKKVKLFIGAALAFLATKTQVFGQPQTDYGVTPRAVPKYGISTTDPGMVNDTFFGKALSVILSPIFIISFTVLAVTVGAVVFIKHNRKHVKKK